MRQVIAVAAIVSALAVAGPAWANDVGQVKTAKGAVHVERDGKLIAATVGMPIRQSDALITGADGAVGVTFSDNSLLSTGPEQRVGGGPLQLRQHDARRQFRRFAKKGHPGRDIRQDGEAIPRRDEGAYAGGDHGRARHRVRRQSRLAPD